MKQLYPNAIPTYFAKGILIDKSYYAIEDGNLYFTKSLETIISEQYLEFGTNLQQANSFITTIYFDIHIFFDRFVPDNTAERNSLALAQATSYALMDYFNQYTYAEVTANMISEIAYTETLTFWSTLISAPLVFLGSWAIMGTQTFLAQAEVGIVRQLLNLVTAPIKEVFQEIIEDGFKEAIAENFVDLIGGTEDVGFWLSSIWTSGREAVSSLATITLGKGDSRANIKTALSVAKAHLSGNTEIKNTILTQLSQELDKKKQDIKEKQEGMKTWQKVINSGAFKGILMMTSAFFFGSLSFLGVNRMFRSAFTITSKAYGEAKTITHTRRKRELIQAYGSNNFYENLGKMEDQTKKPANIDGATLNNIFRSLQKSGTTTETSIIPSTSGAPRINPNPISRQESQLEQKFAEIKELQESMYRAQTEALSFRRRWLTQPGLRVGESVNLMFSFSVKKDMSVSILIKNLNQAKEDMKVTVSNKEVSIEDFDTTILTPQDTVKLRRVFRAAAVNPDVIVNLDNINNRLFPGLDRGQILKYYSILFNRKFDSSTPSSELLLKKIRYNKDEILKAIEVLGGTKYLNLRDDIIVDNEINSQVMAVLKDKYDKGEKFTEQEGLIAGIAIFLMGNNDITESSVDSGREKRSGGDTQSAKFKQDTKNKINRLKQLIHKQLQHYSETGERLSSLKEITPMAGWVSEKTTRKYSQIILLEIFGNPDIAKTVYDMLFGIVFTSYQGVKRAAFDHGFRILTTSAQWFEMVKNREVETSKLYVELECLEKGHKSTVRVDVIQGCYICMVDGFKNKALDFQDVLKLAEDRGIQAVSFKDESKPLTEIEFNDLIEDYIDLNQDPENYKSTSRIYINLRWRHEDHVFEATYNNIVGTKVDLFCPFCVRSVDQRQTYTAFKEKFQQYLPLPQSILYDVRLARILSNPSILLQDEYKSLQDPRVHVDMFGVFNIHGQEFKIAIEHQGGQHSSFDDYLNLNRPRDEANGHYIPTSEYKRRWDSLVLRDKTKVELFKALNNDGYYLIVVDHRVPVSQRANYILQEFIRQTGVNPGQRDIDDWI